MRVSETQFFLDKDAATGLQAQLRTQIAGAILARRVAPGWRMPSSRRMARHLGVARLTVSLAYQDLVADGYLDSNPRSGFFVADDAPGLALPPPERARAASIDWSGWLDTRYAGIRTVQKDRDWRSYPYPFVYGQTDSSLFPHDAWRDCARRALGKREFDQVTADFRAEDDPQLVAHILTYGLPGRGISADADEVLITMGAQHALWQVVYMLSEKRPGLRVVIEEPGYPDLREALRFADAEVIPVPVDDHGLPPEAIPDGVDLVCVTPSHQTPTGATLPVARRKALLALAEQRDFLLLEDDYDFEMSFLAPPTPALKSYDRTGRVIHIGSFSKSLFPGLRLGYLTADAAFIAEARGLRTLMIRHAPGITQRTTAHFLALGHYNAHVERMRNAFMRRRAAILEALAPTPVSLASSVAGGGASVWVAGPPGLDSGRLAQELRQDGVLIEPGEVFFARPAPTNLFRLAYSSIREERIAGGIARIVDALPRAMA